MLPSFYQLVTGHFQLKLIKNGITKCPSEIDMVMVKQIKLKINDK
jgi:hypothetical protein